MDPHKHDERMADLARLLGRLGQSGARSPAMEAEHGSSQGKRGHVIPQPAKRAFVSGSTLMCLLPTWPMQTVSARI